MKRTLKNTAATYEHKIKLPYQVRTYAEGGYYLVKYTGSECETLATLQAKSPDGADREAALFLKI